MIYTFTHPIEKAIEIVADDWFDAQIQLVQKVRHIMDWELYLPDREIDHLVNNVTLFI